MVYQDISNTNSDTNSSGPTKVSASFFQRLLAVIIDYFIFTPVVSFLIVVFFSSGLQMYKQFPDSPEAEIILLQCGFFFVFLFSFLQALFICYAKATPGQLFTKSYIAFENQDFSLLLQAWLRQMGFFISIGLLGIPFIAIFYHRNRQTFYERFTETTVLSRTDAFQVPLIMGDKERRYLGAGVATFFLFTLALAMLSLKNNYNQTVNAATTYEEIRQVVQNKLQKCQELKDIKQENRLKMAIALNMVGVLSDQCLDSEADFVLWHTFAKNNEQLDPAYNHSMAYLAKFMTAQNDEDEARYAQAACHTPQDRGCTLATAFNHKTYNEFLAYLATEKNDFLTDTLKYELSVLAKKPTAELLKKLEAYSSHKFVNKYVTLEELHQLSADLNADLKTDPKNFSQMTNRKPASKMDNKNGQSTDFSSDKISDSKRKQLFRRIESLQKKVLQL